MELTRESADVTRPPPCLCSRSEAAESRKARAVKSPVSARYVDAGVGSPRRFSVSSGHPNPQPPSGFGLEKDSARKFSFSTAA